MKKTLKNHKFNKTKVKKRNKVKKSKKNGGMWRVKSMPKANLVKMETSVAVPYNSNIHNNYTIANVSTIDKSNIIVDNSSYEEQLNELYNDILNGYFTNNINEIKTILDNYPDFDINIKDKKDNSILDIIIQNENVILANKVISSPNISIDTLLDSLLNVDMLITELPINKHFKFIMIKNNIKEKLKNLGYNNNKITI